MFIFINVTVTLSSLVTESAHTQLNTNKEAALSKARHSYSHLKLLISPSFCPLLDVLWIHTFLMLLCVHMFMCMYVCASFLKPVMASNKLHLRYVRNDRVHHLESHSFFSVEVLICTVIRELNKCASMQIVYFSFLYTQTSFLSCSS